MLSRTYSSCSSPRVHKNKRAQRHDRHNIDTPCEQLTQRSPANVIPTCRRYSVLRQTVGESDSHSPRQRTALSRIRCHPDDLDTHDRHMGRNQNSRQRSSKKATTRLGSEQQQKLRNTTATVGAHHMGKPEPPPRENAPPCAFFETVWLTFTTRRVCEWRSPASTAAAAKPASPPTSGTPGITFKAFPACEVAKTPTHTAS